MDLSPSPQPSPEGEGADRGILELNVDLIVLC